MAGGTENNSESIAQWACWIFEFLEKKMRRFGYTIYNEHDAFADRGRNAIGRDA